MREEIENWYGDGELIFVDGFDDAIIGVDYHSHRVIYSTCKCIDIMIAEGMEEEDAWDHFGYNIAGAYVGEKTPIFCLDNL